MTSTMFDVKVERGASRHPEPAWEAKRSTASVDGAGDGRLAGRAGRRPPQDQLIPTSWRP